MYKEKVYSGWEWALGIGLGLIYLGYRFGEIRGAISGFGFSYFSWVLLVTIRKIQYCKTSEENTSKELSGYRVISTLVFSILWIIGSVWLFNYSYHNHKIPTDYKSNSMSTSLNTVGQVDSKQIVVVDYNLNTNKPIVLIKNNSKYYLKDVKIKLTGKGQDGNVLGVFSGNFGITSEVAMSPGDQFAIELGLGNGKIPTGANLTWEINPVEANLTIPQITILGSKMIIEDENPLVTGEIKNNSNYTVSGDLWFDYFRDGKIIGCLSAVNTDTYHIPPGKTISFAEKGYFLPTIPDSYKIHFVYTGD